jgi:carboxymethylenebutenolidase
MKRLFLAGVVAIVGLWLARGAVAVTAATPTATPPAEEEAKARLNASPRHAELASIDVGGTPVRTWIVYPERSDKAPVVIVIHEIFGLTDWIRAVADQLAADGFIAVAPDLLSGKGPNGGGTDAYAGRDDVTKAVFGLPVDEVVRRLDAVRRYALTLPAAAAKSATVGFCWGGAMSFAYAAAQPELTAAVVYYGTPPPEPARLAAVKAPVLGLYGGNDARVTGTVDDTRTKMKALGKSYEPHVFAGAGHGFLRAQSGEDGANARAAREAWPLTVAFLRRLTR